MLSINANGSKWQAVFSAPASSTSNDSNTYRQQHDPEVLSPHFGNMDTSGLENANPTILSVSQLPSRSRKGDAVRHGPDSRCDTIVYPKHAWPYGSSSSSDEDDDGEEPMDAQDIYGKLRSLLTLCPNRLDITTDVLQISSPPYLILNTLTHWASCPL